MNNKKNKMTKKINVIVFGTALFLCSCSGKKTENAENNGINKAFLENVKTEKVVLRNFEQGLILTGKVECDPDKIISYTPLISGIVEKTYFALGDKVQKGQALLDIRSSELSGLQSEQIALETELKIAQRELKTAQSMYDDKMLSERELLEAQGRVRQAQVGLEKVKSDMTVMGTNKGNGIFSIKSPMSGYIVHKKASPGSTLSADGEPIFTVADLSTVWITVNVYASDLQLVSEGMNVEITTLSYPDEVFYGKINSLSQVFDPEEKVLKARIVMNNKGLKFKPEMSVMVKLKNEAPLNPPKGGKQSPLSGGGALSIPSDALIFDDNRYFVVIESKPNEYEIREITLKSHHNKISYISSGLSEGENVVVKNQLLIYQGLKEK
jgi:cobalt-zinc-cadmium efflux system membrane fusion protein